MTYQPPPKEQPPKPKYVPVRNPVEVQAIIDGDYASPIGMCVDNVWYAEVNSLRMYRERLALADAGRQE